MHQAIVSLMEELEATDWYRQRADDCEDESLKRILLHNIKRILLHNMKEEVEHACIAIEWLRRNGETFAKELKEYLFTDKDIVAVEKGGH